jgi:hypothetical protein
MFIDTEPGVGSYEQLKPAVRVKSTPHYVEVERTATSPNGQTYFNVAYIAPRDDTSWWVLACLGDAYDALARQLVKANDPVRYALMKGIEESWPLSSQGLANGFSGRMSPSAIVSLEDPDIVCPRWFAATVRGNVMITEINEMFDQRTDELFDTVISLAGALTQEVTHSQLSGMKVGFRAFGRSVSNDTKAQATWLRDNFASIVKVIDKIPN